MSHSSILSAIAFLFSFFSNGVRREGGKEGVGGRKWERGKEGGREGGDRWVGEGS